MRSGRPFSNHTEFEVWADRYCYRCRKDSEETELYCPILGMAIAEGGWPDEWTARTHTWEAGGKSGSYEVVDTCTEFEERRDDEGDDPEPEPEPPPEVEGQLDLIDAYVDTAIRELTTEPARQVSGV